MKCILILTVLIIIQKETASENDADTPEKALNRECIARKKLAECLLGFNLLKFVSGIFGTFDSKFSERCRGYRALLELNGITPDEVDNEMGKYVCKLCNSKILKALGGTDDCKNVVRACSQTYRKYLKEDIPQSLFYTVKKSFQSTVNVVHKNILKLKEKKKEESPSEETPKGE
ncbi:uncharacterized protein LOC126904464 [Daktulosphaira vitifoliae]|uniref:uncharacterized protein LOC126904464 n=1 Tax=Daktulosphaira vitifoliae TaxID=58002 RepID=UPI0021A9DBB4|nr:uncharacterized protein LOC126904464 [Daktulosphaira vitifoliae]